MELASARPRKKSEGGIEGIAEYFDGCVDVPEIIWIVDRRSPSVAAAAKAVAVTGCRPRACGEILVTEECGCRPNGVDTAEAIVRGEFGIACGDQRSHAQVVARVVRQPSGEQIAPRDRVSRAGFYIERADAPLSCTAEDFHAGLDRNDASFDEPDRPRIERNEIAAEVETEVELVGALEKKRPFLREKEWKLRQIDLPCIDFGLGEVCVDGYDPAKLGCHVVTDIDAGATCQGAIISDEVGGAFDERVQVERESNALMEWRDFERAGAAKV